MNKSLLWRIGCDKGGIFLVGKYEIILRGKSVGTMDVSREGLYYRFRGKCKLPMDNIYRMRILQDDSVGKLGVLVPCNGLFLLDTKRPAKLFTNTVPAFCIESENEAENEWVAIDENTPFPKLADLENGVFMCKEKVPGILFTDPKPDPQGNDPNP